MALNDCISTLSRVYPKAENIGEVTIPSIQKPRIWITGISGFLGWHLGRYLQPQAEVYGTFHRHPIQQAGFTTTALDLTHCQSLKILLRDWQPDAVIHTAACSKPNLCQINPQTSYAINVTATTQLAEYCAVAEIPMVFTSTEWVFDGKSPPYTETDTPNPINYYGEQKAEAEAGILAIYPEAVICRLPLMVGQETPRARNFLQGWLAQMQGGPTLSLFTDEIRTPISVYSAAAGLCLALQHPGIGILHLGGLDRFSRFQLGQLITQTWGFSEQYLSPCRQADVPMAAQRPADVSLNSDKAYRLGYRPDRLVTALEKIKSAAQG